jgi:chromosome segregation ATPase
LGGREQDLATAEAALSEAQSRLAALEQQQDEGADRLNQRLKVLGERELDLASAQRALSHAQSQRDQLGTEIAELQQRRTAMQTQLGALNVGVATLARNQSKATSELEKTSSQLASTQKTLGETEAKLDKAVLAQTVTALTASRDALRQTVADLNSELKVKQPLFVRSVSVNQELVTLDGQVRALADQRDALAAELRELVAQLGQSQAELPADTAQPDESVAKLTGN